MIGGRRLRVGPGAAVAVVLMVAIFAGMSDDMEDQARDMLDPLTLPADQIISGQARIIDGDTLDVEGQRVRLFGIDAVEKAQLCQDNAGHDWPCGHRAADELARMVEGNSVECAVKDQDRYGRAVADCEANGLSLNYWAVRNGWALAYTDFSQAYVKAEREARADRRGIFAGTYIAPDAWRARNKD